MNCTFSQDVVAETISFHGHSCPGLAIGIRAAEYAQREYGALASGGLVCVSETDMCGVDGIQFLTGCTIGKGNLILRDYGKMAFSFYPKGGQQGIRLVFHMPREEMNREEAITRIMEAPLEELFTVSPLTAGPPRPARVLAGLICEECGERTMESRTRRFAGRTLCIPCFAEVEQKV